MAIKINFDSAQNAIQPSIVLAKRTGERIGKIPAKEITLNDSMNAASKVAFTLDKNDFLTDTNSKYIKKTPISLHNLIEKVNGFDIIGKLSDEQINELNEYISIFNKLRNTEIRFLYNGRDVRYKTISAAYEEGNNILLCDKSGEQILLKIDTEQNVYVFDASNIGLSENDSVLVELSFEVPLSVIDSELWNQITDFKTVWVKEWNRFFEIYVKLEESNDLFKTVSAVSLGQAELSQINLYGIEVNTEDDILRDDYVPTVFYNPDNKDASLLDRMLQKAPHYRINHVDASLKKIQRSFSFNKKSIKDGFDEVSEEIECLFSYDCYLNENGEMIREINVYDLKDVCVECGTRGTFTDACTNCGSKNFIPGYGEDTTIFVSTSNLADKIEYSTDTGSVKNCFKLEAGDDLMTATIMNCNPNGSGYLWYIPEETKKDMSYALVKKLEEYDRDYKHYEQEYQLELEGYIFESYNELIRKYSEFTDKFSEIVSQVIGYKDIIKTYYDTIDFGLFLNNELMPNAELPSTTAGFQSAKLNYVSLSPCAVKNLESSSKTTVDNAVLSKAKALIDKRYSVSINGSTYENGTWSGLFVVTNNSDESDTYTTPRVVVNINDDYAAYVKQKIDALLNDKQGVEDTFSVVEMFDLDDTSFINELKKYCLVQLSHFHEICQSCIDIMTEQGISNTSEWGVGKDGLYQSLYLPMVNKLRYIDEEIKFRESEIAIVKGSFSEQGNILDDGMQTILLDRINEIRSALDMENYLGEKLWLELISFRREDTYSNQNYISDNLTNDELLDYASEFIRTAKEDIVKSATLQHTITANLKNLLVMKEFEPIVQYFEVGNWIRVRIDDSVYKLRIVDYQINYDNLESINITFSDVTVAQGCMSDIESILDSASSMATSYNAISRQAKKGNDSSNEISDWVDNGLQVTKLKIVDAAKSQNIKWDEHGILCREYVTETDDYDDRQLKIFNRGLYITNDRWRSARAGIGEFTYYNPATGKMEQSFGVIADTIVGNIMLSKNVGVYNEENTIAIDKAGVTITTNGDLNTEKPQTIFTIQKKTTARNGTEKLTKMLYVNDDGEIVLNGAVKILSGAKFTSFDDFSSVSSKLVDYQAELGQYLSYNENGLILGAANSQFRTAMTNEALRFLDGEFTVAYINNKSLKIQNATIENSLVFGKLTIMPRVGGASFVWVESESE